MTRASKERWRNFQMSTKVSKGASERRTMIFGLDIMTGMPQFGDRNPTRESKLAVSRKLVGASKGPLLSTATGRHRGKTKRLMEVQVRPIPTLAACCWESRNSLDSDTSLLSQACCRIVGLIIAGPSLHSLTGSL